MYDMSYTASPSLLPVRFPTPPNPFIAIFFHQMPSYSHMLPLPVACCGWIVMNILFLDLSDIMSQGQQKMEENSRTLEKIETYLSKGGWYWRWYAARNCVTDLCLFPPVSFHSVRNQPKQRRVLNHSPSHLIFPTHLLHVNAAILNQLFSMHFFPGCQSCLCNCVPMDPIMV